MGNDNRRPVVAYCRVSSNDQLVGLIQQKQEASRYAEQHGCVLLKVFEDTGVSGASLERPALSAMLKYLDEHRADDILVLIYDSTVLGRSQEIYSILASAIAAAGGRIDMSAPPVKEESFRPAFMDTDVTRLLKNFRQNGSTSK